MCYVAAFLRPGFGTIHCLLILQAYNVKGKEGSCHIEHKIPSLLPIESFTGEPDISDRAFIANRDTSEMRQETVLAQEMWRMQDHMHNLELYNTSAG